MAVFNPSISRLNSFVGSATQQATSVVTKTNQRCYELQDACYSVYGFEVRIISSFGHKYAQLALLVQTRSIHWFSPASLSNLGLLYFLSGYDDAVSRLAETRVSPCAHRLSSISLGFLITNPPGHWTQQVWDAMPMSRFLHDRYLKNRWFVLLLYVLITSLMKKFISTSSSIWACPRILVPSTFNTWLSRIIYESIISESTSHHML
jgi:hypothetical protein